MATPIPPPAAGADNTAEELQRLLQGMREALTDTMVERLATTAGAALEVVDRLNEDDTRAAVHDVIDKLGELHRAGAIDTLFESVLLIHAMRCAVTDSIVDRLFAFLEHAANTLGSDEMTALVEDVLGSLNEAGEKTAAAPARGGVMSTLSLLTKPESQQSLQFLLNFGDALRRAQDSSGGR
ncbi:MAG: hypothetical protein ACU85U_14315 [Gammaproteobacteria bacterium]|jgi:uncharacterized protein YjgD (DUF1641 family)